MPAPHAIRLSDADLQEDRYSRLRLIRWWDQERLARAKVLVVGAGALGNEIIKNLVLLGFRQILVNDLDRIEPSNLSRGILFGPDDVGKSKAETVTRAARAIDPDAAIHHLDANVLYEVGLGVFGWADLILAGLDNREARLWINRCAWKMNRPWIDGAIEGLNGVVRLFAPGNPPCYECTLGETDWALLARRMSCNLLTRAEMQGGKVPTTPTAASIVAGLQVQEAVKWIHGLPTLAGKGFVFEGLNHTSYLVEYTENEACLSHETFEEIAPWAKPSAETPIEELLGFARTQLRSPEVVIEFSREVIHKLVCPRCHTEEELFAPVGTVSAARGRCPSDGNLREVTTVHNYTGREPFGQRTLSELGLPPFDVFTARSKSKELVILIEGDRAHVLGPLAVGRHAVERDPTSEPKEA